MAESARTILAQAYEREMRQRLGDGLRRTHDSSVCEPLPSDWLKLIDDFDAGRSSPPTAPSSVLERLSQRLRRE